jgi:hypothetical protein
MRPIEPIHYSNITPERMGAIRAAARAHGLDLHGAKGNTSWDGCGVEYHYDEPAKTLTFRASVPFHVTEAQVEGQLNSVVRRTDPAYAGYVSDQLADSDAADSSTGETDADGEASDAAPVDAESTDDDSAEQDAAPVNSLTK